MFQVLVAINSFNYECFIDESLYMHIYKTNKQTFIEIDERIYKSNTKNKPEI